MVVTLRPKKGSVNLEKSRRIELLYKKTKKNTQGRGKFVQTLLTEGTASIGLDC